MSIDKIRPFCQIVIMTAQIFPNVEEKQGRILMASMAVFSAYGYRRASMEDIAREAGMSRAALYQYFRNKEDILAHGVRAYAETTLANMRAALTPARPLHEALLLGCEAQAGELAKALLDSPHGEELLAMKNGASGKIYQDGMKEVVNLWADWLTGEAAANRIRLPASGARAVAESILAGQHGQKEAAHNYDDYRMRIRVFADLMASALRV